MTWLAPRALWERGCATFIPVIACTRLSVSVNEQKKLASTSPSLLSPHAIFRAFFRSVVPTITKPGTGCAIPVHSPCCRVQRQTPYSRKGVSLNSWLMQGYLFIYYKARVSKTLTFVAHQSASAKNSSTNEFDQSTFPHLRGTLTFPSHFLTW